MAADTLMAFAGEIFYRRKWYSNKEENLINEHVEFLRVYLAFHADVPPNVRGKKRVTSLRKFAWEAACVPQSQEF